MALLSSFSRSRGRRYYVARQATFESLEHRNMPAVLIDVGYHLVEPDSSGQKVVISVVSNGTRDEAVAGFDLRAQIVTAKQGPYFQGVRFASDLWNSFPHIESGGPLPANRTLATGEVAFTQGFEAQANGTLVTLTIDTTGIPGGAYEFRLVGTQLGNSSLRQTDGSSVSEIIANGTLHVRSIWQNPDNPNDINGDGRMSPVDVLLLLNELSKTGTQELPLPSPGEAPPPYYDVNGDGFISPLDPLGAINCLNGLSCVTTPAQILAQVTPDFAPAPGSTGVGEPDPDDSNPEEVPPDDVNPEEPGVCVSYGLDEDGHPVPIFDPENCEGYIGLEPDPLPIGPVAPTDVLSTSDTVIVEPPVDSATSRPATSPIVVMVLPAESVDAVIVELAGEETSDELIDLGLGDPFAIA